jgi:hypothetical protein
MTVFVCNCSNQKEDKYRGPTMEEDGFHNFKKKNPTYFNAIVKDSAYRRKGQA